MNKLMLTLVILLSIMLSSLAALQAARNDWAEGKSGTSSGATRDYYNRAGLLKWKNYLGDWHDRENAPQGDQAYATAEVVDDNREKVVEWDVTGLLREWVQGKHPNQGLLLRSIEGGGSYHFRSREADDESKRPELVVTTDAKTFRLAPTADTYLEPSTYRSQGHSETLRVAMKSNHALLRFDLSQFKRPGEIKRAALRLHCFAQYGRLTTIGVFRCAQGHDVPASEPIQGLAAKYPGDQGIADDPDVLMFADFESENWKDRWTQVAGNLDPIDSDDDRKFEPMQANALRVRIAKGTTTAMNVTYKFKRQQGREPEEIFFRYYLRLADDWKQTVQGGKMPGISGTYGVAGWGGRKVNGKNGWSARGAYHYSIPADNPLAGTHPLGTYCYHADMQGYYGDVWLWQRDYRGYLENNRWYAVEQYLKLNTPGEKDGILRAWIDGRLAFEKQDIRFRHVDSLKIEQIWMNIYHGGTKPSPYDQHAYLDNVVIARKYIGPMNSAAKD